MKKALYIFIPLLILLSCSDSKKQTEPISENRTLYVFHTEIAKPIMEYELVISENDTVTKYSYRNLKNEERNMEFSYDKVSKQLVFVFDQFIPSNRTEYLNNEIHKSAFTNYGLKEPYDDGTGPILFNPEYGVLGIGNSYGPDFVYLPNSNLVLTKDVIAELYK
ncbi:hypothetical protein [Olleya aquimaris]|nr:hypothetical protein [Olleya aquimaris]